MGLNRPAAAFIISSLAACNPANNVADAVNKAIEEGACSIEEGSPDIRHLDCYLSEIDSGLMTYTDVQIQCQGIRRGTQSAALECTFPADREMDNRRLNPVTIPQRFIRTGSRHH